MNEPLVCDTYLEMHKIQLEFDNFCQHLQNLGVSSHTVAYTRIWTKLYTAIAGGLCVTFSEAETDLKLICSLVRREGLNFFTKVLPHVGRAYDSALATGNKLSIPGFPGVESELSSLFQWLWLRVWNSEGEMVTHPSTQSVKGLRQLTYLLYKLELNHGPETEKSVFGAFEKTEAELWENFPPDRPDSEDPIILNARALTCRVFGGFDHLSIVPRHGPGAVSTGEKQPDKVSFKRLYTDLDSVYSFCEYNVFSLGHLVEEPGYLDSLEVLKAGTAKVVLVPKDSRGPRLISCEPLEYQWIQSGLGDKIVSHLEKHPLTKGHVNFTCQEVNRRLALEASKDGELVTLDLKDASDRVSLWLVNQLFCGTSLLSALQACRSTSTKLPDSRIVKMAKFAPMGSGLCFPVEAFVFYAIAVSALVVKKGYKLKRAQKLIYVYGDDIICHFEDYEVVWSALESVGLLLNRAKCCVARGSGIFRESCGVDAFNGVDVTPLRIKSTYESLLNADPGSITAWVSYSNSLCAQGYTHACFFLRKEIDRVVARRYRMVIPFNCPPPRRNPIWCDGRIIFSNEEHTSMGLYYVPNMCENASDLNRSRRAKHRFNRSLYRGEVRTLVAEAVTIKSTCHHNYGWRELLSRYGTRTPRLMPGEYAVRGRVKMLPRWTPYYR